MTEAKTVYSSSGEHFFNNIEDIFDKDALSILLDGDLSKRLTLDIYTAKKQKGKIKNRRATILTYDNGEFSYEYKFPVES
jgi:hypothetical protein